MMLKDKDKEIKDKDKKIKKYCKGKGNFTPPPQAEVAGAVGLNDKLELYQILYDSLLLKFYNYQNEQKQHTSNSKYFKLLNISRDLLFMMLKNKDKEIKDKDKKIKEYCNFPPPRPEIAGAVGCTMGMPQAECDELIKDYERQRNYITQLVYN